MKKLSMPFVAVTVFLFTDLAIASQTALNANVTEALAKDSAASNQPRNALDVGMTAEEVLRLVGKPAEIKPIDARDSKAETWIYRRQVGKQTTHESMPRMVMSATTGGLPEASLGTPSPQEYRIKHTTTYQVTSLLMYEGKLIKAKQAVSEVVSYAP